MTDGRLESILKITARIFGGKCSRKALPQGRQKKWWERDGSLGFRGKGWGQRSRTAGVSCPKRHTQGEGCPHLGHTCLFEPPPQPRAPVSPAGPGAVIYLASDLELVL